MKSNYCHHRRHHSVLNSLCKIVSVLMLSAALACQADTLVFTAIPDADETRLSARFDKVAQYLQQQLAIDVRYVPVKSYAAAVVAFRNNRVQLAWFGGLSGVQARRLSPGATVIAQGREDQNFQSYIIAHSSTGLGFSRQLNPAMAGMTFSFGAKSSTSGRLMPEYYLRQQFQQSPAQLFDRVGFSGNHSRTIALVQSGSYQLGAVNYQVWEQALATGNIDTENVAVIWASPFYQDYHWTVRGDIEQRWGQGFQQKLQAALLAMSDPELLASFPRTGFIAATNDDYQAIADTAKAIGLID